MRENLSIRVYEPVVRVHSHEFHQVVVPLRGAIGMSVSGFTGEISAGNCVIIQREIEHSFSAKTDGRFLVADLAELPDSAKSIESPFAAVSNAFRSFCLFADVQASSQISLKLEDSMIVVLKQLLSRLEFLPEIDSRIHRSLQYIESNLHRRCDLETLASVSSLSITQLKRLFMKQTGKPVSKYILALRMEKARALLVNTDLPISIVAEMVGYSDASAFARRFQAFFGAAPRIYKRR